MFLLRSNLAKPAAFLLLEIMTLNLALPAVAALGQANSPLPARPILWAPKAKTSEKVNAAQAVPGAANAAPTLNLPARLQMQALERAAAMAEMKFGLAGLRTAEYDNGGPSQPEMSSFKPAGADNLVNLFTGDFNYNIPLMDVGGYPINIFYDGNISPEQDASWVGLGWNINPGSITRNLRGVPDDFSGEEKLKQEQDMKPNRTWGVDIGANVEVIGIKALRANSSIGFTANNYLGPALQRGFGIQYTLNLLSAMGSEKSSGSDSVLFAGITGGLSSTISSRSGFTATANLSLEARAKKLGDLGTAGVGVSTSYNSRTGISSINLNANVSKFSADKTISFLKPTYTPQLRVPTVTSAFSGRFALGGAKAGLYFGGNVNVFGSLNRIKDADKTIERPMIGYAYHSLLPDDRNAVSDVSRANDQEIRNSTPIVAVPIHSHDLFSIHGEGSGGTIRLYRNDIGYTSAPTVQGGSESFNAGVDLSIWRHWGININEATNTTRSGDWTSGNFLKGTCDFKPDESDWKPVVFKNPNENAIIPREELERIGGVDLVRYKLGGSATNSAVMPTLEVFDSLLNRKPNIPLAGGKSFLSRRKRNQVISYLTAGEATHVGLEKRILSYAVNTSSFSFPPGHVLDNLINQSFKRDSAFRRDKHFSEITVLEQGGKRMLYGLPVYNLIQKEFLFTTDQGPDTNNLISTGNHMSLSNPLLNNRSHDGFVSITTTPAYAHSYLLTGVLSPDYVDVTGNGISEDDLGTGIRFNYSYTGVQRWRTPQVSNKAFYNDGGTASSFKDNKGLVTYGERENWHLHSVEGKTMIAFFFTSSREDCKNVLDKDGTVASTDVEKYVVRKLDSIKLFNKADLVVNGLNGATPIKSVFFDYDYALCKKYVGNYNNPATSTQTGKLTLKSISFSFGRTRSLKKSRYVFGYDPSNPDYAVNVTDRWGVFKPSSANPGGLRTDQHPYASQSANRSEQVGAWMLKSILTPAGAKIEVELESDDYAFVQNKRACRMMKVLGFSADPNTWYSPRLYEQAGGGNYRQRDYVYVEVEKSCSNATEVYDRYLKGLDQIALSVSVNMPKGAEQLRVYGKLDGNNYGVFTGDASGKTIFFRLQRVEGSYAPVMLSAFEFLRQRLPGQAFPGYDLSDQTAIKQIAKMLKAMYASIKEAFRNPIKVFQSKGYAQTVNVHHSFARLCEPLGRKKGGQSRVKAITISDNWNQMTGQASASYGQHYDYTVRDEVSGERISSGVASFEPAIGAEENPHTTMVLFGDRNPAAPTTFGSVEMPAMDALFPAPSVGYSKVTVTSLRKMKGGKLARSAGGRQVTEFYTARDFPTKYMFTPLTPDADWKHVQSSNSSFRRSSTFDTRTLSQGFLVITNDMHGQMKAQALYNLSDTSAPHHLTKYYYSNTGQKGLEQRYKFINTRGEIVEETRGVDIELMTDLREFKQQGFTKEKQAQVDLIVFVPVLTSWPVNGTVTSIYKEIVATKSVAYHAVVDSVVVTDKGSTVATANLAYDAETGDVLVTQTNNAFDKPIYNVSYPAHWLYPAAGSAYRNIDFTINKIDIHNGVIVNSNGLIDYIEAGDVFYVSDKDRKSSFCGRSPATADSVRKLWALHTGKNITSFFGYRANGELRLVDKNGVPYNMDSVSLKIIRSGYRNTPAVPIQTIITLSKPFSSTSGLERLALDNDRVLQASALEMSEKWLVDKSVVRAGEWISGRMGNDVYSCGFQDFRIMKINPYNTGTFGLLRVSAKLSFQNGRLQQNLTSQPNLQIAGTLADFEPYYNFDPVNGQLQEQMVDHWMTTNTISHYHRNGAPVQATNSIGIHQATKFDLGDNSPIAIAVNTTFGEILSLNFESRPNLTIHNESCVSTPYNRTITYAGQVFSNRSEAHTGKNGLLLDTMHVRTSGGYTHVDNPYAVVTGFKSKEDRNNNLQFESRPYDGYTCQAKGAITSGEYMFNPYFEVEPGKQYWISCWVKEQCGVGSLTCQQSSYDNVELRRGVIGGSRDTAGTLGEFYSYEVLRPSGPIIDGWQKIEGVINAGPRQSLGLFNLDGKVTYLDDLRIHPVGAAMRTMVYDPLTQKLVAELDENNFATFYEYDAEGTLIRKKKETLQGVKTLVESRSATQSIVQP